MLKLINCSILWTFRSDLNEAIKAYTARNEIEVKTPSRYKTYEQKPDDADSNEIEQFQFDTKIENQQHLTKLTLLAAKNSGF